MGRPAKAGAGVRRGRRWPCIGCATAAVRGPDGATAGRRGPPDSAGSRGRAAGAGGDAAVGRAFRTLRRSLISESQGDFNVADAGGDRLGTADDSARRSSCLSPECIVLMNNSTVEPVPRVPARASAQRLRRAAFPPSVIVMALFIDELRPTAGERHRHRLRGSGRRGAGRFLRSVIKAPIRRVGVIYRPSFRQFIERQRDLAEKEHIELVTLSRWARGVYADRLRSSLHLLAGRAAGRRALWMINDNELIKSSEYLD